jgi:hypothetical protein
LNYQEGSFPGTGGGTVQRYYHDPITNECKLFSYRGTGGNANNFETKEHCESYCLQCMLFAKLKTHTPRLQLANVAVRSTAAPVTRVIRV